MLFKIAQRVVYGAIGGVAAAVIGGTFLGNPRAIAHPAIPFVTSALFAIAPKGKK